MVSTTLAGRPSSSLLTCTRILPFFKRCALLVLVLHQPGPCSCWLANTGSGSPSAGPSTSLTDSIIGTTSASRGANHASASPSAGANSAIRMTSLILSSSTRRSRRSMVTRALAAAENSSSSPQSQPSHQPPPARATKTTPSSKIQLLLETTREQFSKKADPTKATYIANYMRKSPPTLYHGLQASERRAIQNQVLSQLQSSDNASGNSSSSGSMLIQSAADYCAVIQALWEQPYREEKLFAIDLALQHKEYIHWDHIPFYEHVLLRDDCMWWDFCDPIAVHLIGGVALDDWDRMEPILQQWIGDEQHDQNKWIRRTAILAQLKHKTRTHADVLEDFILQTCHEKEFFLRKAIGWALREYGKTNPQRVKAFLLQHKDKLSPLSYREGSRILVKNGIM